MAALHEPESDAIFSTLRRFARRRPDIEMCELCGAPLGAVHPHLIEPARHKLACACDACAILFSGQGAAKYKRVSRRVRALRDFRLDEGQWDGLAIPIGLAFFFFSSPLHKVVAFYPSPAGATESLLSLDTWNDLVATDPVLEEMEPDVEALLVNRVGQLRGSAPPAYYLAPIDACYRLVGVIRANWRGFSGGTETWDEIGRFFAGLDASAEAVTGAPVPDLSFSIEKAGAVPFCASPTLAFSLRIDSVPAGEVIHTVALRCQIQIEASRRRYAPEEQARLKDLFGDPDRWSSTVRALLWTQVSLVVPAFTDTTVVDLPVSCTFDFNVAATKYFHGVGEGELPLCFQFSGTVFYEGTDGALQVSPISWTQEARFRLPVAAWRDVMDAYYPNSAWLCLRRDAFDRLYLYKVRRGMPTWEQTLDSVLERAEGTRADAEEAVSS